MYKYAQISEDNIVIGVSTLSGIVNSPNMVLLDGDSIVVPEWLYDPITGEFTPPPINPTPIKPQPTLEEMQAQTLLNMEYLVSRSELGV